MTPLITTFVFIAVIVFALRSRLLAWAAARPLVTTIIAITIGLIYRQFSLPGMDPALMRGYAQFGLGMMVFLAAQQCRISRLQKISPAAFRLAALGSVIFLVLFSVVGFAIVPGMGLLSTLIVGGAIMLAGAPVVAAPLLKAPISAETKCTARIEGAATLTIALPLAIMIEAGATPISVGATLSESPVFLAFAGFSVGGTLGLLAGRFLPLPKSAMPVMPFLVALAAYGMGIFMGFEPVMAAAGAGLLYSEEAPLMGDVRTRVWRVGEGMITPIALFGFGFVLGPILLQGNLLMWVAGIIAASIARVGARFIALRGVDLNPRDHSFILWFGGAPGAAAALFLISLIASPASLVDDNAITFGAVTIFVGILVTRLHSRHLTERLVQKTAHARKRRFSHA